MRNSPRYLFTEKQSSTFILMDRNKKKKKQKHSKCKVRCFTLSLIKIVTLAFSDFTDFLKKVLLRNCISTANGNPVNVLCVKI